MTFARRPYPKPPRAPLVPIPRDIAERISYGPARLSVPVPKVKPVRSEEYRRLVAALDCDMCGAPGPSQAAHPNTGKGLARKADDRLCFPLCADAPGVVGCHTQFDQGALLPKHERREYEQEAGQRTRETINRMGLWPQGLAQWTAGGSG